VRFPFFNRKDFSVHQYQRPHVVACLCLLLTLAGANASRAVILTNVPMQGGMVMPMISYSNSDSALHVNMPATVPQLTPLLISNPSDNFDPADPWFNSLDPTRQGLSFSRRYGFVMDAGSDPLPPGTAIWIRRLSSSPGLEAYRYSGSGTKAWDPIFGTAGSSNAMYWSGMMFHPAFAAMPGTNPLSAVFEAYLVDVNLNTEVPGTATGPMNFSWSNVFDGRPTLDMGLRFAITWPTATTSYVLEAADSMTSTNWTLVTNGTMTVDGQPTVLVGPGETMKFYRMRPMP
jgi:hypothetical protein